MKSTVKVSISGIAFNLDDDAYLLLKDYLDKLSLHFSKIEGGSEIIEDIEARMAELLLASISSFEQTITAKDAVKVIDTLGSPEELHSNVQTNTAENSYSYPQSSISKKRLYRDPENQIVAGVCGGLGVYFNIDPVILRVLFAALAISGSFLGIYNLGGIAVIAYIVLWISLPKALTIAQKLEMQGESPSVVNIERKMREEALKSSATKSQQKHFSSFSKLIRISFYILAVIIAIPIICVGIALIVTFIALVFSGGWILHDSVFPLMDFVSIAGAHLTALKIIIVLVAIIPLLLLVYASVRLLFRFKGKSKGLVLSLAASWVVGIFGLIGIGVYTFKDYRSEARITTHETLVTTSDTVYIILPNNFKQNNSRIYLGWCINNSYPHIPLIWINEQENIVSFFPDIDVRYVNDSSITISYTRFARGISSGLAHKEA